MPEDKEELSRTLMAELKPKGPIEMSVFHQLAHSAWVLQRLGEAEAQTADARTERTVQRLAKYRDTHRKLYEKSLAWLRKLQTERATKNPVDLQTAREEAPLADPQRIERALRKQRPRRTLPAIDLEKIPPVTNLIQ